MSFDRKYLVFGLAFAVIGMGLGIFMAATGNHGQLVTHAHVLLVGFVVSFIYAVIHKLWLDAGSPRLANFQFFAHILGVLVMVVGLFLLYGRFVAEATLEPFLSTSSIFVLVGALLMIVLVVKAGPKPA